MSQWTAIVIVFGLFAIGDFVSVKTGAKISSVFVALMLFLALFMSGIIPKDIMSISELASAQKIAGSALVFHMGTNINLRQLKEEWRTLVLAVLSMGVALISVFLVIPLIGWENAVVAVPIVNGGIMATNIMVEAATAKGLTVAAALGSLAFAVQKFVGTVPASRAGLTEANNIVKDLRAKKAADPNYSYYAEKEAKLNAKNPGGAKKVPFWKKNEKIWTTYTCLFVVYAANIAATTLAGMTNNVITSSIWGLLLGAAASEFGLVPPKILNYAGANGFFMVLAYVSIIASLGKISFSDFLGVSFDLVVIFAAVVAGTYFFLYVLPGWKVVGSKNLAVGIAMAQLLGYPATYLITQEIAKAVGETQEERDAISDRIEPAYVIAGFATVTSLSIVIAGFFVNLL